MKRVTLLTFALLMTALLAPPAALGGETGDQIVRIKGSIVATLSRDMVAEGRVIGDLQGYLVSKMRGDSLMNPANNGLGFRGESCFQTSQGTIGTADFVMLSPTRDPELKRWASWHTILRGDGEYQFATGRIFCFGTFDQTTGTLRLDYTGAIQ